jgi:predicted dehydrogenase
MERIRLGIIGMGRWARQCHLKNIRQLPSFQVAAISSRNQENINKALEVIENEPIIFKDWRNLVESEEVEAVIVTTPNHTHEEIAYCALEAGKHVLVEKPPALTVEGCDRLIDVSTRTGRILQVGFELRYSGLYQRAKELIASGEIGKVQLMWCMGFRGPFLTSWRLKQEISGGTLLELSTHHFDIFNWFAEAKPLSVCATGSANIHPKAEVLDNAIVTIEYEGNIRAALLMCLFSPHGNELEIGAIGEKGKIECFDKSQRITMYSAEQQDPRECSIVPPPGVVEHQHHGTLMQLKAFGKCVRKNMQPLVDGTAGRWSVAVAVAAEKSIKERRPVEIDPNE